MSGSLFPEEDKIHEHITQSRRSIIAQIDGVNPGILADIEDAGRTCEHCGRVFKNTIGLTWHQMFSKKCPGAGRM